MEAMRKAWTDERLDDLTVRMDRGFDRADRDLRDFKLGTDARFDRVDARFDRVDDRFDRLEARFDSLQRLLLAGYLTAVLGLIATQL